MSLEKEEKGKPRFSLQESELGLNHSHQAP
jgi:hypothetical protein